MHNCNITGYNLLKNHIKTPTCFGLRPSSGSYNILVKVNIDFSEDILTPWRWS